MEMDTVMVGSVALVVVLVRSLRDARFWHMRLGTISACRWVRADLDSWKGGVAFACPSVCVRCAPRPSAQLVAAVYIYLKRRRFNSTTTATSRRSYMELGVPGARSFERCDTVSHPRHGYPPRHGRPPAARSSHRSWESRAAACPRFTCAAYHTAAILPRFRRFSPARLLCFRRHVRRSTPRRAVLAAPANETPLQVRRRGHRQPGVADR